jgi:hypothetical protein
MFETIYIANISEDVWQFINLMSDSFSKGLEIEENAKLSDRDIFSFSGQKNVLIILPYYIDTEFIKYFSELTENNQITVAFPKIHTGEICKDIINDRDLFNYIIRNTVKSKQVSVISYSSSTQFYILIEKIKNSGINVFLKESPSIQDSWIVDFYGSKSGIRQLSLSSENDEPDFKMPEGLITSGINNAAKIAANTYLNYGGIVIKTNKGHSGAGIIIYRPHDLPKNYVSAEKIIYSTLKKEKYWGYFPIIIEKYMEANQSIGGGFPNVEYKINKSGKIVFLYYCSMRITKQGEFKGVEIHNSVLSRKISAQIVDTGFYIAENYKKYGYAGYFDVDFISNKDNQVYVSESNIRRTGGTHVYHLARHLFGEDFMYARYTVSNNLYVIKNNNIGTFSDLSNLLKPVLYNKTTKEGLIIISISLIHQHKFGYVIFGKNKKSISDIESKMDKLLGY